MLGQGLPLGRCLFRRSPITSTLRRDTYLSTLKLESGVGLDLTALSFNPISSSSYTYALVKCVLGDLERCLRGEGGWRV